MTSTNDQVDEGDNSSNSHKRSMTPTTLLCFDVKHFSRVWLFSTTTLGVFGFYLVYGFFLELVFRLDGFREFGWYLTLVQFAYYSAFSWIEGLLRDMGTTGSSRQIPLKLYCLLAFLTVATMGLSNSAVGYLNYPTQVIFKCCKLIPVLIGGLIIQGKTYNLKDVIACVLMSAGLVLFTLGDTEVTPSFNMYGVFLISLALCADAVIGNFQEKYMKQYPESSYNVIFYSYSIGFVVIFCGLVLSNNMWPAFNFCSKYPMKTYGYAFLLSMSGYLGLSFVLVQIKAFGALTAVTVTTCRKAVTVCLSFVFFSKPFTSKYLLSGVVVVAGIYLNLYSKNQAHMDAAMVRILKKVKQLKNRLLNSSQTSDAVAHV